MAVNGEEYIYGNYPFGTYAEQEKVNELAMQIRNERKVEVYVRKIKQPEQLENRMVVDSEWDEIEYGVPKRKNRRNQVIK